mmetsp:Transcript_7542/g.14935  ORF Transcript_7542/g.14935 Transcript_7542/m.14935 type:complete len:146 (-) Transcript_7542:2-439(-)
MQSMPACTSTKARAETRDGATGGGSRPAPSASAAACCHGSAWLGLACPGFSVLSFWLRSSFLPLQRSDGDQRLIGRALQHIYLSLASFRGPRRRKADGTWSRKGRKSIWETGIENLLPTTPVQLGSRLMRYAFYGFVERPKLNNA